MSLGRFGARPATFRTLSARENAADRRAGASGALLPSWRGLFSPLRPNIRQRSRKYTAPAPECAGLAPLRPFERAHSSQTAAVVLRARVEILQPATSGPLSAREACPTGQLAHPGLSCPASAVFFRHRARIFASARENTPRPTPNARVWLHCGRSNGRTRAKQPQSSSRPGSRESARARTAPSRSGSPRRSGSSRRARVGWPPLRRRER